MKVYPYLITIPGVQFNRRPRCFRSTRLWTITVLVAASREFDDHDEAEFWSVRWVRVISIDGPGRGLMAHRFSPDARNRLDALLDDEGPIEAAILDGLDNHADYLGDLPATLAAEHGMEVSR